MQFPYIKKTELTDNKNEFKKLIQTPCKYNVEDVPFLMSAEYLDNQFFYKENEIHRRH